MSDFLLRPPLLSKLHTGSPSSSFMKSMVLWAMNEYDEALDFCKRKGYRRMWHRVYYNVAPFQILARHPNFKDILDVTQEEWDKIEPRLRRIIRAAYELFENERMIWKS